MEAKTEPWSWLVLSFLLLAANCMQQYCVHGEPQVPFLFIFGDSLSDSGNNNKLLTLARANYRPNGYDFPEGPTGRGVNYASGSAGIRNETGKHLSCIPKLLTTCPHQQECNPLGGSLGRHSWCREAVAAIGDEGTGVVGGINLEGPDARGRRRGCQRRRGRGGRRQRDTWL
ncbi:GDSL esterase/lipase, partial [Mucuna pruriens]